MARRRGRLAAFAREWLAPAAAGLGGAALLIAGVERGGWIAWATLVVAWAALVAVVAWGVRAFLEDADALAAWPDGVDDPAAPPSDYPADP